MPMDSSLAFDPAWRPPGRRTHGMPRLRQPRSASATPASVRLVLQAVGPPQTPRSEQLPTPRLALPGRARLPRRLRSCPPSPRVQPSEWYRGPWAAQLHPDSAAIYRRRLRRRRHLQTAALHSASRPPPRHDSSCASRASRAICASQHPPLARASRMPPGRRSSISGRAPVSPRPGPRPLASYEPPSAARRRGAPG